jgi:pyruvate dehydrogenase E2 component (dihydrolipoamide acetyltransferase)
MVHGFGSSLETWSGNQPALAAAGHVVAALDLPGHGESSLDVGSGSLDELASLVLAYMDAMGIARAHLVGHSMGGAVCLAATDRSPARVRTLTLIGPAGFGQKINADVVRGLVAARSRDELAPLLRILFADATHVTDRLLNRMVAHRQRAGAVEALMQIAASRYALTPSGRQLRDVAGAVPTLVIWGAEDRMVQPPATDPLVRDGVSLRVLPHAGHMVQIEAAEAVNRLILDFLRA